MAARGTYEWRANISAARKLQVGEDAPHWMGDRAKLESVKTRGRVIARKLCPKPERCERCNRKLGRAWARHHKDGNTCNNARENVECICQSCHMKIDNPQHHKKVIIIARVKYDVSSAQPQQFAVPKPDVYDAVVEEMSHGNSSSGNPMFTIKFQITKGDHKDARIWYYILTDGTQEWRLREFTDAVGLKPKGTLDTDELKGKAVQIRTAIDPARDGYDEKARIKNVLATGGGAAAEEDDEPYEEWSIEDLKEELEARELKVTGRATKAKLVKALEDDDEANPEGDEEEGEEEEGEEEEGEEEGDDEETLTRADLEKMSRTELKTLIKEEELEVKVLKKDTDDQLREKIAEALELGEDEEEEEGEEEGDEEGEDTDYEEWDVSELKAELKERGLKEEGRKSVLVGRLKKDDASGEEPF